MELNEEQRLMLAKDSLKHLKSPDAILARKAVDYYLGDQLGHMEILMNDDQKGRVDWNLQGYRLVYRNLTNMVINASSMLYNDGLPTLEIDGQESQTQALQDILDDCEIDEYLINSDAIVRLLKTCHTLVEYVEADSENVNQTKDDCFKLQLLHKGNSTVSDHHVFYTTGHSGDQHFFRLIMKDIIVDYVAGRELEDLKMVSQMDNPFGFLPISVMHDTNLPMNGEYNSIPQDLILTNESFNMYLIDSQYAASFSMRKTLFTNAEISTDSLVQEANIDADRRTDIRNQTTTGNETSSSIGAGPGNIVRLESTGGDAMFVQYLGPDINLDQVKEMYDSQAKQTAQDWSVSMTMSGDADATSGFHVVVQEIPNLTLKSQRQRMAERYLERLFKVIIDINNIVLPQSNGLPRDSDIDFVITFEKPRLPIEAEKQFELLKNRVDMGITSKADMLSILDNITVEEAQVIIDKIAEENNKEDAAFLEAVGDSIPNLAEEEDIT